MWGFFVFGVSHPCHISFRLLHLVLTFMPYNRQLDGSGQMTAEIAICNANGIALAADSAVSMGDGDKIYNSANKLFTLSKFHPVAIMVYNSGSLLKVPWETIIKQYREQLGDTEFAALSEYCDHFWAFIHKNLSWFPKEDIDLFIRAKTQRLLLEIRGEFLKVATDTKTDPSDEAAVKTILLQVLSDYQKVVSGFGFAINFDDQDIKDLHKEHSALFTEVSEKVLENIFDLLIDAEKDTLFEIFSANLCRTYFDHYSGVVIAGFGKDEIHPKVATYKAGIFANKKLRLTFDQSLSNVQDKAFIPQIFPYAQDDVVRSFIQGVDPEIDNYLVTIFSELDTLASQIPEDALAGSNDTELAESREKIRQKIEDVSGQLLTNYRQTKFDLGTSELLAMLAVLPKDELAEMAESLVNLTAFKRRMTAAKESVGGPIDVAILSKGDGFIWIKRKHYFKPELNQNFFHNYFPE